MKIDRLLAITVMLLNRRRVTAGELADYFEVSPRTIYRDFDTLNRAGIPIISYQGYEGGFCIPDNYKLSRQLLTYDDMVSIITSLKGINTSLKNREISTVIEKITSLIPPERQDEYKKHRDSFIIDMSPWGGAPLNQDTLALVHGAVADSRTLQFSYTTGNGVSSSREVQPYALVFKNLNWYLLAFCILRGDFRIFRLSRMREPAIQPNIFVRQDIAPLTFFQADGDSSPPLEFVLHFSATIHHRLQEMFDAKQLKILDSGIIEVRLALPESNWTSSFLLSFADDVEVISPPEWRSKIAGQITRMKNIYRDIA